MYKNWLKYYMQTTSTTMKFHQFQYGKYNTMKSIYGNSPRGVVSKHERETTTARRSYKCTQYTTDRQTDILHLDWGPPNMYIILILVCIVEPQTRLGNE